MLANNIANASTAGFKLDRENYNLYISQDALDSDPDSAAPAPVIDKHWTDFAQGNLVATGNSLDFALEGPGFFSVDGPAGTMYTRNGSFRLSPSGRLETQEGYPVRMSGGGNASLDPRIPVEVGKDGSVSQNGVRIGQLETTDFPGAELTKTGSTYFQVRDPVSRLAASVEVRQGSLESANVTPSETAIRLVDVMRQYEMLQRAVSLAGEMNRRSVEEVAKVS